jgi:hypothetical protein
MKMKDAHIVPPLRRENPESAMFFISLLSILMSEYHVTALWDDEAKVWVGTSQDVPGLCVEARTLEEPTQTAGELIPDLLILNGVLPQGDTRPVPFHITAERSALARAC